MRWLIYFSLRTQIIVWLSEHPIPFNFTDNILMKRMVWNKSEAPVIFVT